MFRREIVPKPATMGASMTRTFRPFPAAALIAAALMLAGCQGGFEGPAAERARPAEVPPAVPAAVDTDACWAQARIGAEERMFAVPCPAAATPEFWASVQRALAVRGLYTGPVTGANDAATGEAVRRFQAPLGLDSPVLSLDAARQLGLMRWPM